MEDETLDLMVCNFFTYHVHCVEPVDTVVCYISVLQWAALPDHILLRVAPDQHQHKIPDGSGPLHHNSLGTAIPAK